jgi:hypothetical protein
MTKKYERSTRTEKKSIYIEQKNSDLIALLQELPLDADVSFESCNGRDCYCSSELDVTWERLETDEEFEQRVADEKASEKAAKSKKDAYQRKQAEREIETLKKLAKKYPSALEPFGE